MAVKKIKIVSRHSKFHQFTASACISITLSSFITYAYFKFHFHLISLCANEVLLQSSIAIIKSNSNWQMKIHERFRYCYGVVVERSSRSQNAAPLNNKRYITFRNSNSAEWVPYIDSFQFSCSTHYKRSVLSKLLAKRVIQLKFQSIKIDKNYNGNIDMSFVIKIVRD